MGTMDFTLPTNYEVWFYAIATLAAIVWLSWQYSLAVESSRWPCVQGKVIKAWVKETWGSEQNYSPQVEYIYKVDGVIYTSFTIRLTGDISCGKRRAERIAAWYDGRDPLSVWYDPSKPERATLKPGGAGWLMAGLLVVSILGPLLAFAATTAGRRFLSQMGINSD